MTEPKPKGQPKRDRSNSVLIDLGTLRQTLRKLASIDAIETGEPLNYTRTVRRLIREEAGRRGIGTTP
jgi:hypothetical protein